MALPFSKAKKGFPARAKDAPIDTKGRRLIGETFEGQPLWAPKGHSLLLSANGGGKTTCGVMPWLLSLICANPRPAMVVVDVKDGEIAAQCAPMLDTYGIPVAVIDDMGVFPEDYPYRVSVNPISAVVDAFELNPADTVFATEQANTAVLPDPASGPDRNQFFRDGPRTLMEFCLNSTAMRTPHLTTPGSVWAMLADPDLLKQAADLEAENGTGMARILAKNVLAMKETEYFPMHREAAMKALRVFALGSHLHTVGIGADTTHFDLIQQRSVIFLVAPQRYATRMSGYFAQHLQSFLDALYRGAGPLTFVNDEFTNAPLKSFVDALTTIRGYGGEAHNVAQSRSEIEKKFGKQETLTIEENAIVKQWFGFSSFDEAERVSKAMGESLVVQQGLNVDYQDAKKMGSGLSLGRQRQMSPAELMAMPDDEQLWWVKGVGFGRAKKLRQNQIAPFCHDLAPNPLEGGVLPPDPKITLKFTTGEDE